MKTFKVISLLLRYPTPDWLAALPDMEGALADEASLNGDARDTLAPLFERLREFPLIVLQEDYVATFDRNPSHALYLFKHVHGEPRDRGSAMIDLLEQYWKHDFDASGAELPDHVPLFLEFLSLLQADEVLELLGDATHVLATIGHKLEANGSVYAAAFKVLEALSQVIARQVDAPSAHDISNPMERFEPSMKGGEPLREPAPGVAGGGCRHRAGRRPQFRSYGTSAT